MTEPERPASISSDVPETEANGAATTDAEPSRTEPEPEPWTPERASEWNAYYDVYVMLGALLLVFLASSNRINHASIWTQLQVGRAILAKGAPVLTDQFSYTEAGKPWVNVPWLFDLSHAALHKATTEAVPGDQADPAGSAARAEQVGAGALVALNALARLLTALVLLGIRRAGPGGWWSAVCVTLALGVVVSPPGVQLGGIALPGAVSPETWGLLFLAVEFWLLDRAVHPGRRRHGVGDTESPDEVPALTTSGRAGVSVWLLPLVFLVWANVDESFLVGLALLAAWSMGRARPAVGERPGAPNVKIALGLLVACGLACLANPSFARVYAAAVDPFLSLFRPANGFVTVDQLSYFGAAIRRQEGTGNVWKTFVLYYVAVVAVGLVSFLLNRRRFSWSRFLTYALATVLWGIFIRLGAEFAVVFAATLALNGQEWYHDRVGTSGRIGLGWSLWSVGGRAVTIVVLFAAVGRALTGYGASFEESRFGYGFDPDDFAFEAAEHLKTAPILGNVLNTTVALGDALIWRASPERKTYLDSRRYLFPPKVLSRLHEVRQALRVDDLPRWKPILDEYKISVVMLQPIGSAATYQTLSQSENWLLFHDDGNVVMFGRADAPEPDLAYFKANRLDPEKSAYQRAKPSPSPERPPSPVTWMDNVFQARALTQPQSHTYAARRWLFGFGADAGTQSFPDPARCLLAVREARTALAAKPDDPQAYRVLAAAYRMLMTEETAMLAGLAITPDNIPKYAQLNPRADLLSTRFRQRVTALNYAIQTTPPPKSAAARRDLQSLNLELYQLFLSSNFADLARDRLQMVLEKSGAADFPPDLRAQLSVQLGKLNEQVKLVQEQMSNLAVERQYGPIQLAGYAISQGDPGLALHELEDAEQTGTNPALVKPQLLDLYCDTGQPEKAIEMLSAGTVEDPSFGSEPGISAVRQARAYFLLGNDDYASTLWERYAIPRIRWARAERTLSAAQTFVKGEIKTATAAYLEIPEKIGLQATWEFEVGLCRLESGVPEAAAAHFTKALELAPKMVLRPIAAYYLEKIGKPIPNAEGNTRPAEGQDKEKEKDKDKDKDKEKEKVEAPSTTTPPE